MSTLLQIKSSLFADHGQSSQLADVFVAAWQAGHPGTTVAVRDLAREPVPHLDGERFQALVSQPDQRTAAQQAIVDQADALVSELRAAKVLVLGLPMYNFGIPSVLKAWIDHIARAGVTFRYTESGPQGLLTGIKAYVIAARGGHYVGTAQDTQTAYMKQVLAFVGITDVEFIYAEGLALGEDSKRSSIATARSALARHATTPVTSRSSSDLAA